MNNYFKMWLDGWKVVWRITVIRLIVLLLASPLYLLHHFITNKLEETGNSDNMTVYLIYAIIAILAIFPFLYSIASSIRGEFVYPRYKPKRTEPETINLPEVPEDSEPIHPDNMKSWNPITGYNSNESGEGLNQSTMDTEK